MNKLDIENHSDLIFCNKCRHVLLSINSKKTKHSIGGQNYFKVNFSHIAKTDLFYYSQTNKLKEPTSWIFDRKIFINKTCKNYTFKKVNIDEEDFQR